LARKEKGIKENENKIIGKVRSVLSGIAYLSFHVPSSLVQFERTLELKQERAESQKLSEE